MERIILFRILNLVFLIVLFGLCKVEHKKMSYFYTEQLRKCTIVAKDIRQYNASNSRVVDLRYKNVFIVSSEGTTFGVTVSDELYYKKQVGNIVYFELSLYDMYDAMPETKIGAISYQANCPFILFCILFVVSIIIFFCLETWKLLKSSNVTSPN